mmetsp:Transcript_7117/g.10085  ORF Transcript_7117/g.10085 Transcript_7117/m.10085 type:complete len:436 (-) Transcript_7117:79-1386(-)|eukprot:CAMPEP_0170085502 /NCGR_PEP_ID=MMETSP0019_2-20121128/20361_1 /TAXON_ID=98059 /ORGANISM="Dinobryon sp., Strain UTEXLB2267" /LENGTH=435 /DNA_ID=CAMNT_0010301979 /DNA_START=436 /DNA_END=1740 /DNA_ORIENTATION=-
MSALPSLKPSATTTREFPILMGSSNIGAFTRAINDRLSSHYGNVGQHILNKSVHELYPPGPKPHYSDLRLHPTTSQPILNSRRYERIPATAEELATANFDPLTLPLTPESNAILYHDIDHWRKSSDTYNKEIKEQRALDDQLLNFIYDHTTTDAHEIISANALIPAFRQLPTTCITPSDQYLKIIASQFAHGNSTVSINELTKFLTLTQGPVQTDPTAAFFNRLNEQYERVLPLLDHATDLAALKAMLLCMVAIKGVNKTHPPSLRALEIHLQTYPGNTSLAHYDAFRTAVLASQDSDIFSTALSDPISEQSSAFTALPFITPLVPTQPPVKSASIPGQQRPGRTDHCGYCYRTFAKYHYHKESACNMKKQGITASSPRRQPRPAPSAVSANSTTVAVVPSHPRQLSHAELTSFLATQGLEWFTPPVVDDPIQEL